MSHHNHLCYSWRDFKAADLQQMSLVEDEANLAYMHAFRLENLVGKERSWCGIAFHDDIPLALGGWYETKPGVARAFLFVDKHALLYPKTFFRTTKNWVDYIAGLDWVETLECVGINTDRINSWLNHLGFICEGPTGHYTLSGAQYLLWRRET